MQDHQEIKDSLVITLKKACGDVASTMQDTLQLTGRVHIDLFGPDGALKETRDINNLVVTAGRAAIASMLQSLTLSPTHAVSATANAGGLIQITTSTNHLLQTGQDVFIYNVGGTVEANGFWVVTRVSNTQFTLNGSTFVSAWTSGGTVLSGPAEFSWMGLGTGVVAPSAGDTDLGAEISTGLTSRVTITRTNPSSVSILYSSTWNPGQATNAAITEAALFNSSALGPAAGTALARSTFTAIPKGAGDTLTINWTITLS